LLRAKNASTFGRRRFACALACGLAVTLSREAVAEMARFEVTGSTSTRDANLEVVVFLKNAGDAAAAPVEVEGEMFEERSRMRLDRGVAPGESDHVILSFPLAAARPGQAALILLIEWPVGPPAGNAAVPAKASQRAYLVLSLGSGASPAVRLSVPDLTLETLGTLKVGLESADGAPHRILLRVHPPRGLNVFGPPVETDVPASGRAFASLQLLRAGAPRASRQGILVEAQAVGDSVERTTIVTSVVTVGPDPALLPKLRPGLWVLAALLVGASAYMALLARRA
jgi:hypothetical protein